MLDQYQEYNADNTDDEILGCLRQEAAAWDSAYSNNVINAKTYLDFIYQDQWDSSVRSLRTVTKKPCMSFNILVSIIRSILGEARRNSPDIKIIGVGKDGNSSECELRTDIIRKICYDSNANTVYEIALKSMIEIGWGAIFVDVQYKPGTFDKEIILQRMDDYQCCYWDPSAQKADRSDGDYCGMYKIMTVRDFKSKYPDVPDPTNASSCYYLSMTNVKVIIIADTYKKEYFTKKLCLLSDKKVLVKKEAKEYIKKMDDIRLQIESERNAIIENAVEQGASEMQLMQLLMQIPQVPEPISIEDEREESDYKIMHYRWVGNSLLEKQEYISKDLPIVYFEGDSTVIDGVRYPLPFIKESIDLQTMVNYYGSEVAFSVLNSRREQFMGTDMHIAGREDIIRNAQNTLGFLPFTPDARVGGNGLPTLINPVPFNPGLMEAMNNSMMQIRQVLGRPDESQGFQTNAISGVAVGKRQEASNNAVNVYHDNWKRGIQQVGKIINNLLPIIYDTEKEIQVLGADNKMSMVQVNKVTQTLEYDDDGTPKPKLENKIEDGQYSIEVKVAGSYDSQQEEKVILFKEFLSILMTLDPQSARALCVKMPSLLGLEDTVQIENMLKLTATPEVKAVLEGKDPSTVQKQQEMNPMMMMEAKKMQMEEKTLDLKEKELKMKVLLKDEEIKLDSQKILNERMKIVIDGKIAGIDMESTMRAAESDILTTKIRATAELEKAKLTKETEQIKHHTQRMGHIVSMHKKVQN